MVCDEYGYKRVKFSIDTMSRVPLPSVMVVTDQCAFTARATTRNVVTTTASVTAAGGAASITIACPPEGATTRPDGLWYFDYHSSKRTLPLAVQQADHQAHTIVRNRTAIDENEWLTSNQAKQRLSD